MATINMKQDIKSAILSEVFRSFEEERVPLLSKKFMPSTTLADKIYSSIFSEEDQNKYLSALPAWARPLALQDYMHIRVSTAGKTSTYDPVVRLEFSQPKARLPATPAFVDLSGPYKQHWHNNLLCVMLEDTNMLPSDEAGKFIKELYDVSKKHNAISIASREAVAKTEAFLDQFRTLQAAIKALPALSAYIPDWLKKELDREPVKRTRKPPKPKEELKEIDMSDLVARATISKLNL